ncbi:MAG: PH domain-containing protein [Actinomycetota bacterium]|nr:PH domain-containing protein [Actinomycetota bacterium]
MAAGTDERVCLDARQHGIVLAGPLAAALASGAVGAFAVARGWPYSLPGALVLAAAAAVALRAVWRWEGTRVVVTTKKLVVVRGLLRRRASAVPLTRLGAVEVEQTLAGRMLGYGTIVAGDLEISHVPEADRLYGLVEQLSA